MRAYYLNPKITPEGLKELDAIPDKHAQVCREGIASLLAEAKWDDCEAVRRSRESVLAHLVTSLILFG